MIWLKILTWKPLKSQYQFIKEAASQYSLFFGFFWFFLHAPTPETKLILLQGLPEGDYRMQTGTHRPISQNPPTTLAVILYR